MVKKRQVGKKKKDDLPKEPPVEAFDLEFINETDLKRYICKLEKEIEQMRQDLDCSYANKDMMLQFLEARRDASTLQIKESFVNNCAVNDSIEQLKILPEKRKENLIVNNQEKIKRKLESLYSDFVARSSLQAYHLDKEHSLRKELIDRDLQLENNSFLSKIGTVDTKNTFQDALEEIDKRNSRKLEEIMKQNVRRILKANEDFNADRIRMLTSIWYIEDPTDSATDSYVSELKCMQDFFLEISLNNNEVIKLLRTKLSNLMTEDKKVHFNLKQMVMENKELKTTQKPTLSLTNSVSPKLTASLDVKKVEKDKNIEMLKLKNEILKQRLRVVKVNFENMKKQLINSIRKIYQRADYKTYLLEEILNLKLKEENKMPEKDSYEHHVIGGLKREQEKESRRFNTISMKFEESDTLFVPPVYHKFWDPSIKKHFSRKII